ncbi:Uma2 family endonuclease [Methylomonas rapida]|uniref:Uma2 family endonuclease n=1 Tax=Methylomonas rapida TaxID=2963939 RepID=A0ABY7GIU2_9GAMM|nr:Uma2 family endonuclease [Methylomonas rapida]WAR44476.1 Uma2 family endonuclease [Methylomonas rapida]
MQTAQRLRMTADDFLAWEETQVEKHEFVAGEVFAMVGARREHVVVSGNIFAGLKQRLRGKPCHAYMADLKLRIEAVDAFFYPDVVVSCDQNDNKADQYISHPTLIVEVLSDSTAAYDRGGKFVAYRKLESLKEYLIVDIDARRVECFRRMHNNDWLLHDYVGEVDCELNSLGLRLPLTEIFEDIG